MPEVDAIEDGFALFVSRWEAIFYVEGVKRGGVVVGAERVRVRLCRMCIHLTLHLAEQIRIWGRLVLYSQYTIERIIGQLKHTMYSRSKPFENITANAVRRQTQAIARHLCPEAIFEDPDVRGSLKTSVADSLFVLHHPQLRGRLNEEQRRAMYACFGVEFPLDGGDADGLRLQVLGQVCQSHWSSVSQCLG